jgi:hypothetical protein
MEMCPPRSAPSGGHTRRGAGEIVSEVGDGSIGGLHPLAIAGVAACGSASSTGSSATSPQVTSPPSPQALASVVQATVRTINLTSRFVMTFRQASGGASLSRESIALTMPLGDLILTSGQLEKVLAVLDEGVSQSFYELVS